VIALIQKIKGKIAYLNRKLTLFVWDALSLDTFAPSSAIDLQYSEFDSIASLTSITFQYNKVVLEERFLQHHILCVLQDSQGVVASYGWYNHSGTHYLGELDLTMNLPQEFSVLYDFQTYERYRGKGLYSYLLHKICKRDATKKIIYAFPDNQSSCKGILKANFKVVGTLSGMNKKMYSKMITR
jgi:hypothetical protein